MHKQNRLTEVLLPSSASGLVCLLVAILTLSITTFYYFAGNGAIYDFVFGKGSSVELISQSTGAVNAFTNTIFSNVLLNKILYFAFWMMVGLLVYLLLYIVVKSLSSAAEDIEQAGYTNTRFEEFKNAIVGRLLLRAVLLVSWLIYWGAFIKIILPFCILSARVGATLFPNISGWFYLVIAGLTLALALQLHVVFMRLIALKVRLFS